MHQLPLIHPLMLIFLAPVGAVAGAFLGIALLTASLSRLAAAWNHEVWWPRVASPLGRRPCPDAPLDAEALSQEGIRVDFERSGPDEAERVRRLRTRRAKP
jgi:hypothetical protein